MEKYDHKAVDQYLAKRPDFALGVCATITALAVLVVTGFIIYTIARLILGAFSDAPPLIAGLGALAFMYPYMMLVQTRLNALLWNHLLRQTVKKREKGIQYSEWSEEFWPPEEDMEEPRPEITAQSIRETIQMGRKELDSDV